MLLMGFVRYFFEPTYLIGLWAFGPLDDVELDFITFFEALVALALDGAVVDEDVCPAVAAEESVALCIVEPLYRSLILCQWSNSLSSCRSEAVPREVEALRG